VRLRRGFEALVAGALLAAAPAWAEDATQQAKTLFYAGAQAYEAGQYQAAIQAFTEAYKLSPRPGILFSMAQAHKKQYALDRRPAEAREAVRLYREYVAKVEQGGRRADAAQALSELEPIVDKLGGETAAPPPAERKSPTRLMVSVQAKEATIALDGGKPVGAPFVGEVKPGKHSVKVTAAGYFPEEREVQAAEGGVVAVDVQMREQPGLLTVVARAGADVTIDGRIAASTPMWRPIEVPAGRHFVAVTKRGYKGYSDDLDISRGEARTVTAPLEVTGQRVAAYALFGVAAAGAITGGILAVVSVHEQGQAQSIDTTRTTAGGLTDAQLTQYNGFVSSRNAFRTAAGVALAGAFVVGATGVVLVLADQPVVGPAVHRDEPKPATPAPSERPLEVSAAPLVGPGLYGASLVGRF
jgi:PEGA domain